MAGKYWFKLLAGTHTQDEPDVDENRKPVLDKEGKAKVHEVTYKKGQKFKADTRLDERFGFDKFQLLESRPQSPGPVSKSTSEIESDAGTQNETKLTTGNPDAPDGDSAKSAGDKSGDKDQPRPGQGRNRSNELKN